ncbi:unnamed protein product [Porites lobata]|uniref:Uncharacterized protein n=1 Tax=Porites lobata TaxID=104759 RepID=A0ABN8RI34_9CNID|nr:unnamed protein product [Porites lobata]
MRPAWAGMMQVIHQGNHKGKSSITFLPMIDMNPSDVTCVSSTLKFVSEHAQRHNIANPIVTFDQPLWWTAFNIIQTEQADSDLRKVILRLGAFHTEMSFLGTIGHLMAGSGLRELLELIYASNAVDHILTGKAIARAVRAHLIVDAALNAPLYSAALGVPIPQHQHAGMVTLDANNSQSQNKILQEAHALFKGLMEKKMSVEEVSATGVLDVIQQRANTQRDHISGTSRTGALRSDRLWAGLSTDLVIEQVLMRSLKTSGGLTRGRGFTEQQRLIWLLSMPACAETNRAMQELTGVKSNSGEQNKDMSKARQKSGCEGHTCHPHNL